MAIKLSSDNRRIAVNSVFLVALTFSNYLIGLLLYPYLSRTLSIENFGLFGFATSFVLIFQVVIEFGFMISATALISKNRSDKEKLAEIISATMTAKLFLAAISCLLFMIAGLFVPMLKDHFFFIFLFFIDSVIKAMMPDFFYRGIEKMKSITIRTVVVRLVMIGLVLVTVKGDTDMLFIPTSFIIADSLALMIALRGLKEKDIKLRLGSIKAAILSIKNSFMFFLSRLALSVNQSLGSFFLGFKYSPNSIELGLFSGATKVSSASELMIPAVSDSLYPHMINKKDYSLFKKVLGFGGVLWLFACVLIYALAPQICTILLGENYAQAGDYLRILVFGNFMALFSNFFGYPALSPIGKDRHANIAILISASINVIACIVLWLFNAISITSICIVITCSNLVVFTYRFIVFFRNKHLAHKETS